MCGNYACMKECTDEDCDSIICTQCVIKSPAECDSCDLTLCKNCTSPTSICTICDNISYCNKCVQGKSCDGCYTDGCCDDCLVGCMESNCDKVQCIECNPMCVGCDEYNYCFDCMLTCAMCGLKKGSCCISECDQVECKTKFCSGGSLCRVWQKTVG